MFQITDSTDRWEKIDLGPHGDIEVCVRPPTWDEHCRDTESLSGYVAHRIATTIVGWRGVCDENGASVDFSPEVLQRACQSCPRLFAAVLALANAAYRGLDRKTVKNSAAPPVEVSTDAASETPSSNAGPVSAD